MKKFYATDDEITFLRSEYEAWKQAGCPTGDKNILPLLEQFNTIPGVATTSSCESHNKTPSCPLDTLYVWCAVTQEGFNHLFELFQNTHAEIVLRETAYREVKGGHHSGLGFPCVPPQYFALVFSTKTYKKNKDEVLSYMCVAIKAKNSYRSNVKEAVLRLLSDQINVLMASIETPST